MWLELGGDEKLDNKFMNERPTLFNHLQERLDKVRLQA
jgi:hypothetical protein